MLLELVGQVAGKVGALVGGVLEAAGLPAALSSPGPQAVAVSASAAAMPVAASNGRMDRMETIPPDAQCLMCNGFMP